MDVPATQHGMILGSVDEFEQVAGSCDLNHAEEALGELVVAGGNRAVDVEMTEHALDAVAFLVKDAVVDDRAACGLSDRG